MKSHAVLALCLLAVNAQAFDAPAPATPFAATGTVEYAFTPGDRIDDMIIAAINAAHEEVLVQAYSFTHRDIAQALIAAQQRGVKVTLLADREQTFSLHTSVVGNIATAGVAVLLDDQHTAAHNKIIVIDAARADCAVVTGSFNFTIGAQFHNAENALVLRGDVPLCAAYRANWLRHLAHALPYR